MPVRPLQHSLLTSPNARIPQAVSDEDGEPAWFDSLAELDAWRAAQVARKRDGDAWLRNAWTGLRTGPKLLACHDFKGGYADRPFERGYTFEWWSMTDLFIYFSHHRVTVPPEPWISAAHSHGTRILGVLILEWEQSLPDAATLVLGPSSSAPGSRFFANPHALPGSRFPLISSHYADALVDLAVERGFDGWLVNVECDLFKACRENPVRGAEWARAIRAWVEILRREGERRLGPGWEVSWYDSIMHSTGQLRWLSRLDPVNTLPFACSASSTFLDYHWRPVLYPFISRLSFDLAKRVLGSQRPPEADPPTVVGDLGKAWRSKLSPRESEEVYLGVDLFGRGCPFGGGFAGTRAAEESKAPGLSVAMFANGWTWECHHLHPGRRGEEYDLGWWKGWWEDERYMWIGLARLPAAEDGSAHRKSGYSPAYERPRHLETEPSTGNALRDAHRIDREAERTEGPPGSGFSELPRHRPWSTLFPPRPNRLLAGASSWSTSFSLGSGCAFWVEGVNVLPDQRWTDPAMSQPKPDLALGGTGSWIVRDGELAWSGWQGVCEHVDDRGWMGSGCVEVRLGAAAEGAEDVGDPAAVPLISTSMMLPRGTKVEVGIIWAGSSVDAPAGVFVGLALASDSTASRAETPGTPAIMVEEDSAGPVILTGDDASSLVVDDARSVELKNGWHRTTCALSFKPADPFGRSSAAESVVVSRIGVVLARTCDRILVGGVSVSTGAPAPSRPSDEARVHWISSAPPAGAPEGTIWGAVKFTASGPFALCLVYAGGGGRNEGELICSSRTYGKERRVVISGLGSGCTRVVVREVRGDGSGLEELGCVGIVS